MVQRYREKYIGLPKPIPLVGMVALFLFVLIGVCLLLAKIPSYQMPISSQRVKVSLIPFQKVPKKSKEEKPRQIIEAEQPETLPPQDARFLGKNNHQTTREVKVKNPRQNANRASNTSVAKFDRKISSSIPSKSGEMSGTRAHVESPRGTRSIPKGAYQALLPRLQELRSVQEKSHQDLVDGDMAEGQVLDVNTSEYKWIGYFTNVRRSVAQTYFSPYSKIGRTKTVREKLALYGKVQMKGQAVAQLTIARSGVLIDSKLVGSSGDQEIDQFWLRVLHLAAPYPPLPKHYDKDELTFTYSFHYHMEWARENSKFHFPAASSPF